MTWWLISHEDVEKIRAGLNNLSAAFQFGPFGLDEELCSAILYTLDTGLHQTDAIPADFQEETTAE